LRGGEMGRWIVATLVLILVLSALGANAGAQKRNEKKTPKRSERVVEAPYDLPGLISPSSPASLCHTGYSCPQIPTATTERFVRIEIEDATGTATAFFLGQNTDPDSPALEEDYGTFCGSTGKKPIRLEALGAPLVVVPLVFGDVVCPGAVGTTGTVKATLSNLR
jgi:hypothetical protein